MGRSMPITCIVNSFSSGAAAIFLGTLPSGFRSEERAGAQGAGERLPFAEQGGKDL